MSLDHILLGILRTPTSGYDVKQQFDTVFSHFWAADLPQIYRTLNRMERDGLLAVSAQASTKGPERRVYRTTAAGRRALRAWLSTAPTLATERIGYLAQTIFLAALGDDTKALTFMRSLRQVLADEHAVLLAIGREWAATDPAYPDCENADEFYAQVTLDLGMEKLATKVAWADRSIARIEARIARQLKEQGDGHSA